MRKIITLAEVLVLVFRDVTGIRLVEDGGICCSRINTKSMENKNNDELPSSIDQNTLLAHPLFKTTPLKGESIVTKSTLNLEQDTHSKKIEEKLKEYQECFNQQDNFTGTGGSSINHCESAIHVSSSIKPIQDEKESPFSEKRSRSNSWNKYGAKPQSIRASLIEERILLSQKEKFEKRTHVKDQIAPDENRSCNPCILI